MAYLRITAANDIIWYTHFGLGSCALPTWLAVLLIVGGIAEGVLLGVWWWQKVYVEHKHWRFNK